MVEYRYRIRDWDKNFETHRSRDLEYVRWLSVPNKQHGMGFTRIMAEEDGAAIFGIWYLIIEACSQARAPRQGWLTDDGRADGTPWTIDDMAVKWRRKVGEIARALDVLCSPKVGWMETVDRACDAPAVDVNRAKGVDLERGAGETRGDRGENAGSAPDAAAAPAPDQKQQDREAIRAALKRLRWHCSDSAVDDWVAFLKDAGCRSIHEAVDCLNWVKREARKDGKTIKWARHADGFEVRWRNRPRPAEAVTP